MSRKEANTRKELIDQALETAGWNLNDSNQVGIETLVDELIEFTEQLAA